MSMPLYRDFTSQRKLSLQYDPLADIGGMAALEGVLAERARLSAFALKKIDVLASLRYGPTLRESLDFYPARSKDAPIVLFIHGGYWVDTRIVKEQFAWVASSFVESGFNAAVMDYEVGPRVTIDEIVRQCRAAVAWLRVNGGQYGADPSCLYLIGNSVGGHLLSMAAITDWEGGYGLPRDTVTAGCAISGIFDLEPIPYTWIQPMLQLEWGEVRRNSPIRLVPREGPPLLVSYGTAETGEFQRQSADFARSWEAAGNPTRVVIQPDCNHFTVMNGLTDTGSLFFREVLAHMASAGVVAPAPTKGSAE